MSHYSHWDPINGIPLNQPLQYPPRHSSNTVRYSRYNGSYSFNNPAGAGDVGELLDYSGPYPVPQLQASLNILREQMSNPRREKLTRIKRKIGFLPDGSHDTALTGWGEASCKFCNKEDFAEVSIPAKKQRHEPASTVTSASLDTCEPVQNLTKIMKEKPILIDEISDKDSGRVSVVSVSSGLSTDSDCVLERVETPAALSQTSQEAGGDDHLVCSVTLTLPDTGESKATVGARSSMSESGDAPNMEDSKLSDIDLTRNNIPVITSDQSYVCDYCSYMCNTEEQLRNHLVSEKHYSGSLVATEIKDGKPIPCSYKTPMIVVNRPAQFQSFLPRCPICREVFPDTFSCGRHFSMKHGQQSETGSIFWLDKILMEETVDCSFFKPYCCRTCGLSFASRPSMLQHMDKEKHGICKPKEGNDVVYRCSECSLYSICLADAVFHVGVHSKASNVGLNVLFTEGKPVAQCLLLTDTVEAIKLAIRELKNDLKRVGGKHNRTKSGKKKRKGIRQSIKNLKSIIHKC